MTVDVRSEQVPGICDDLGKYHAESGRINADLTLKANIKGLAVLDSGTDWYASAFNFYTAPQWKGDKVGFSVKVSYSFINLDEVFARVKRAEKGIEMMLASATDHNWDCKSATDVIRCILSLEDQTKHIYAEREDAAQKRREIVYGSKTKE